MDTIALVKEMPSTRLTNYCFNNERNFLFNNVSANWGFDEAAVSNGATYADLDNDGDEDLVVNNLNDEAFIYKNETDNQRSNHSIMVHLKGPKTNTRAVGAKVFVRTYYTGPGKLFHSRVSICSFWSLDFRYGRRTDCRRDLRSMARSYIQQNPEYSRRYNLDDPVW
jgi:hypothetical protein